MLRAAEAWLVERLTTPLAADLPRARWSIRSRRMSGTDLLTAANDALLPLRHRCRDDPVVLIACHSDLDLQHIRTLARRQSLFHASRRPKAAMAGEGAAVLVLSAVVWPTTAALDQPRVCLTPPGVLRRSPPAAVAGRDAWTDTCDLVRLGLARAGLNGAAVARLASDSDQHTLQATELFAVTLALLPELDANDDCRLAGTLAGRLEAVGPLVALACAAAQVRASGQPALALSLADPLARMAAVLTPRTFAPVPAPASP